MTTKGSGRENFDGDFLDAIQPMIVCEKTIATVNDGAGEMKGVGNAQAVSGSEFRCHVPNGGIGVNQLHAFRCEESIVSLQNRPIILPQRFHAALQTAKMGNDGYVWPIPCSCETGAHRLSERRGPLDEVNDRRGVQVEAHSYSGQSLRRAAI